MGNNREISVSNEKRPILEWLSPMAPRKDTRLCVEWCVLGGVLKNRKLMVAIQGSERSEDKVVWKESQCCQTAWRVPKLHRVIVDDYRSGFNT